MKRICAWCGEDLGTAAPASDPSVTHGMCERCLRQFVDLDALAAVRAAADEQIQQALKKLSGQ